MDAIGDRDELSRRRGGGGEEEEERGEGSSERRFQMGEVGRASEEAVVIGGGNWRHFIGNGGLTRAR